MSHRYWEQASPFKNLLMIGFFKILLFFFKEVNALITFYVFSKLALILVFVTVNLAKRNSNLEKNFLKKYFLSEN